MFMRLLLASSVANVELAVLLVGKSLGPEWNVWGHHVKSS